MTGPISTSTTAANGAGTVIPARSAAETAKLKDAAEAFEAIFLRQMISSMRQATPGDTLFGNDAGNQFRDMSDSRLADDMAANNSFGIAEALLRQFGVES